MAASLWSRLIGQRAARSCSATHHTDRLELHVTHACNLACESCSHYSNHGHSGNLSLEDAYAWMAPWSRRLTLDRFVLLGGEPSIHPELPSFVPLVRRHWPQARIRIVTNGFFLDRHPDLPRVLAADGNCELALSVHHDAAAYRDRLEPIFDLLETWQRSHSIVVMVWESHTRWTRRYRGFGELMLPFEDGQPRRSWEICPARHCKQLFDGKVWKCPPITYLSMQKRKYDLSPKWDPYLSYQPLELTCSDGELAGFLQREEEPICAMCSAEPRLFALPIPLRATTATSEAKS